MGNGIPHLLLLFFALTGCALKNRGIILNWYVIQGDPVVVKEKLSDGALVDGIKSDTYTPLMIAAWTGNLEIVNLLLDSGANVNRTTPNGLSPLLFASYRNHAEIAGILLDRGADPAQAPAKQPNALQIIGMIGDEGIVRTYKERGYTIEAAKGSERKKEEILSIVRINALGFKIIYDRYLHLRPGFRGKLTFRFSIAPDGRIIQIALKSSTTNYPEFDAAIQDELEAWRFGKIDGKSNDIITVPFTFDE